MVNNYTIFIIKSQLSYVMYEKDKKLITYTYNFLVSFYSLFFKIVIFEIKETQTKVLQQKNYAKILEKPAKISYIEKFL